jgi:fumarylacetoacetase
MVQLTGMPGGGPATSWTGVEGDDPFGVHNLPYGSARDASGNRRVLVRIGNRALDLTAATAESAFAELFAGGTIDRLLAAGPATWSAVRTLVSEWLTDPAAQNVIEPLLVPLDAQNLRLPFSVADYVDFYASEQHATNVGRLFRPGAEPLTPNWKQLPIGYHGRAGTVVVSGTEVRRPHGQLRRDDATVFGPTERLDLEAEVGFVVGVGSRLGAPVPLAAFRNHVFGVCLLNDWSARDVQAWEYVPLGPFLGKSFATSVSAWVTPLAALTEAWVEPPPRDVPLQAYLDDAERRDSLQIALEVVLNGAVVSRPPFASMYWTPAQMLAHMTVNGASLRTGDLYASGTVSGPDPDQFGSLLELTRNGAQPVIAGDEVRGFLLDGDEVVITAVAHGGALPVGLGEVRGRIAPAA